MSKLNEYIEFLKNKVQLTSGDGLKPVDMHPSLFPHQKSIVGWALQRGKALMAAKFGMGKSRIQIELMRQVACADRAQSLGHLPLGLNINSFTRRAGDGRCLQIHRQ